MTSDEEIGVTLAAHLEVLALLPTEEHAVYLDRLDLTVQELRAMKGILIQFIKELDAAWVRSLDRTIILEAAKPRSSEAELREDAVKERERVEAYVLAMDEKRRALLSQLSPPPPPPPPPASRNLLGTLSGRLLVKKGQESRVRAWLRDSWRRLGR